MKEQKPIAKETPLKKIKPTSAKNFGWKKTAKVPAMGRPSKYESPLQ